MRLLEAVLICLFAMASRAEAGGFETVVTLDNGEFNMPLYTPRWNGQWAQPSAAQEIATSVARIIGANPAVYTYLPPGRTEGRPGEPIRIAPRLPRCDGPAEDADDPCYCGPADKCWENIGPNYHPDSSTSLYLTTAAVRAAYSGRGSRLEVHFSDLFEEDPSAADNPGDLDRCVTQAGTRKAVAGLMSVGEGETLDHVSVGVLRVKVEPPPPGPHRGFTYDLSSDDGKCWTGEKGFPWESLRQPYEMSLGVLVVGVGTARESIEVDAFVDGLVAQLTSETMSIEMVKIREPSSARSVERIVTLPKDGVWQLDAPERAFGVPCDAVEITGTMESGGQPVAVDALTADCDGGAVIRFSDNELERAFLRRAGLDPRVGETRLSGSMKLRGAPDAIASALGALRAFNDATAHRPMPMLDGILKPLAEDVARPLTHDVTITSLTVSGIDSRPWSLALIMALAMGGIAGASSFFWLQKVQADRAFQAHWDRAVGPDDDPLRQKPLASVIADAQEEVRGRMFGRAIVGFIALLIGGAIGVWLILYLYQVTLG